MERQNGRALTYPHASFDREYSVSVIEHLPDDGEHAAILGIVRARKPGGRACITVPHSDKGNVETFGREYRTDSADALVHRRGAWQMITGQITIVKR